MNQAALKWEISYCTLDFQKLSKKAEWSHSIAMLHHSSNRFTQKECTVQKFHWLSVLSHWLYIEISFEWLTTMSRVSWTKALWIESFQRKDINFAVSVVPFVVVVIVLINFIKKQNYRHLIKWTTTTTLKANENQKQQLICFIFLETLAKLQYAISNLYYHRYNI